MTGIRTYISIITEFLMVLVLQFKGKKQQIKKTKSKCLLLIRNTFNGKGKQVSSEKTEDIPREPESKESPHSQMTEKTSNQN
jgi:hypothetical protein